MSGARGTTLQRAPGDAFAAPLVVLLEQQQQVLTDLVLALQRERVALVTVDVPVIEACAHEKDLLCQRQDVLEAARRDLVARHGHGGATLADLADDAPGTTGTRLRELRGTLRALATTAQEINALNRGLLEHAQSCVAATVQTLQQVLADRPTYGGGGRMKPGRPTVGTALSRRL